MERKGGTKRKKVRSTGVPSLLLGIFLGFVIGIISIGGVGAYLYFNVSVNWLNSAFKTEYDLGNYDLNNTTISEFVTHIIGLSQNLDSYTLNDLQLDFGVEIPDEMCGINISSIKDVPLTQLEDAIKNMTVADMFGEDANSGVLSLIKDSTLGSLATDLNDVLSSTTLGELISLKIVSAPSNYASIHEKYLTINLGTVSEPIYKQVENLTIGDLIDVLVEILSENDSYLTDTAPNS